MQPIKSLVAGYIDHMRDKAYVDAVFGQAPLPEIDDLLADMLRCGIREDAGQASQFVLDAVMFGLSPEFARYLPRSSALRAVRENIGAEDYFTRHQSLHTLGRIGPRANAQHLATAFQWYLQYDPLNLDDLLGELFWLKPRTPREPYLEAMMTAPLYLARWAVMSHLLDHGSYMGSGRANERFRPQIFNYLRKLTQDPHERVRAEAVWRLDQLQTEKSITLDRTAGQHASEPQLTFFTLRLHVGNYLSISGRRNYAFSLVERIAQYVEKHPTYPGIDIHEYWGIFANTEP